MCRLVVNTFVSLDGIMQAPGAPDEGPQQRVLAGGWSANHSDDGTGQAMARAPGRSELLLGRRACTMTTCERAGMGGP
jgi:hypothetical protein